MRSAAWRVSISLCLALCACRGEPPAVSDARDVIDLRWLQAHARESRADVETGLLWGLSLLGAKLPQGAPVISWRGERITLDLAHARMVEGTESAWRELLAELKASGEYRVHGAVDVGRFLAVTLGSPDRYYSLTGAEPRYEVARVRYQFDDRSAAIVRSSVAHGSRRIEISHARRAREIAFVAFEGTGSLDDGSFVARELELLDVMANGQLRFAVYALDGSLKPAATRELTAAGKPAKCMWCHESHLLKTFVDFSPVKGYYDRDEFDALVARRNVLLAEFRRGLDTQIDYDEHQDHTFAELLYLSFEEPSRERLAREWGVSPAQAAERLRGKPTHAHAEFTFLGAELYRREDVERLAPYEVFPAPHHVRELSPEEHGKSR